MPHPTAIVDLLRSLFPKNSEELVLLKWIINCAQSTRKASRVSKSLSAEVEELLAAIPEDTRRHFHQLAEALEIYQSIHGEALTTLTDDSIHTVRQIRDLCADPTNLRLSL